MAFVTCTVALVVRDFPRVRNIDAYTVSPIPSLAKRPAPGIPAARLVIALSVPVCAIWFAPEGPVQVEHAAAPAPAGVLIGLHTCHNPDAPITRT